MDTLSRSASALLVAALSGCSAVGYPSPVTPPAPSGVAVASSGDVSRSGEGDRSPPVALDPGALADLVPEPRSRRGNAASYQVWGRTYHTLPSADDYDEEGLASWYGDEFAGRPTSSGETFDPDRLTAAHRSIPLPSWVEVTNLENGRAVLVRVNDRGPFADTERRIIDLSEAAARKLDMIAAGVVRVRVRVVMGPVEPGAVGSGG